jgi:hypothetical protein
LSYSSLTYSAKYYMILKCGSRVSSSGAPMRCSDSTIGCSRSNNLLLGRVEALVGAHPVISNRLLSNQRSRAAKIEDATYRFTPCRDADVLIRGDDYPSERRIVREDRSERLPYWWIMASLPLGDALRYNPERQRGTLSAAPRPRANAQGYIAPHSRADAWGL